MSASLPLSPPVFAILSGLIAERLGIHYTPQDAPILADKITPRALEHGFESLLDYYYFLRYDPAAAEELDALADALVVNETYFFREVDALREVVEVLARIHDDGRRPRLWCAASSTGEEPLTLAMLLDDRHLLDHVDLVASDVSPRALARARDGVYRGRAFRVLPDAYRDRFFRPHAEALRVDERLLSAIDYRAVNLLDDAKISTLGSFDVILCRNVLIYFHDDLVRRIAGRLTARLTVGGYLLVGTSESLLRFGTSLTCVERAGTFFYQRGEL